jgi:hypothetical protein
MLMTDLDLYTLPTVSLTYITADSPIVCATLRLAQTLSHAHDKQMQAGAGWYTLKTLTLGQWLGNLHGALALRSKAPATLNHLRVLNAFQEQLVWESVIKAQIDSTAESLFDLQALAANAAQAHKLAIEWNIPISGDGQGSEEQQQFHQWQIAFRAYCQEKCLIDCASLYAQLIDYLPEVDHGLLPTQLCFAGFDHYTALEKKLHAQLNACGIKVLALDQAGRTGHITRISPPDLDQECLAIATWAKRHLTRNPQARHCGSEPRGLSTAFARCARRHAHTRAYYCAQCTPTPAVQHQSRASLIQHTHCAMRPHATSGHW